jgi:uncharacterized protein YndB with AHSA1/START domain
MSKPDFVYVTYIVTTPETLWNALLDPELTKLYWANHRNRSDWKKGSSWRHEIHDKPEQVHIEGTVLETDPPRRLVITWGRPGEMDAGRISRVTFEIEPGPDAVRLTVTHDGLDPDMLRGISSGWPAVLSSLKSLLETGKAITLAAPK